MFVSLLPLIIVLPFVGFWAWMCRDMPWNEELPKGANGVVFQWPPVF